MPVQETETHHECGTFLICGRGPSRGPERVLPSVLNFNTGHALDAHCGCSSGHTYSQTERNGPASAHQKTPPTQRLVCHSIDPINFSGPAQAPAPWTCSLLAFMPSSTARHRFRTSHQSDPKLPNQRPNLALADPSLRSRKHAKGGWLCPSSQHGIRDGSFSCARDV